MCDDESLEQDRKIRVYKDRKTQRKGYLPVQSLTVDRRTQITYRTSVYVNLIQSSMRASKMKDQTRKRISKGNYRQRTKDLISDEKPPSPQENGQQPPH